MLYYVIINGFFGLNSDEVTGFCRIERDSKCTESETEMKKKKKRKQMVSKW